MMLGGSSEARPATPEIQVIADKVRPHLEEKTKEKYEKFEAVEYKSQVVQGENYFIKMDVGGSRYIILEAFREISKNGDWELHSYQAI